MYINNKYTFINGMFVKNVVNRAFHALELSAPGTECFSFNSDLSRSLKLRRADDEIHGNGHIDCKLAVISQTL